MRGHGEPECTPIAVTSVTLSGVWGSSHAEWGSCLCSLGGRLGLGVCRTSHWSTWASLGGAAGAQAWHLHRVPEPLELILPVVLLADAHVAQGSIGTPVVSISACFLLFNKAIVFDDSHR